MDSNSHRTENAWDQVFKYSFVIDVPILSMAATNIKSETMRGSAT